MIRKKKKYSKPRKAYDITRIKEENELVNRYGLKSKREIWKAEASVSRIRNLAKKLITASGEKQTEFFEKLGKMGIKAEKIADVLDLKKEDWLKRRLQSVIIEKNIAKPKQARQLIAHRHISINGKIVNIPSYIVKTDEENSIKLVGIKTPEMKKLEEEIKEIGGQNE